jgi:hypothetical protein
MTKTFFADSATLMSPRTAKYIEALIREGDNFDYDKWLRRVRKEEAQAKHDQAVITPPAVITAEVKNPISASDFRGRRSFRGRALMRRLALGPGALRRPHRQAKSQSPKARLTRWFEKVRRASGELQTSRSRDAVYDYLESVFAIVEHYRVRRRTNRLLQRAFAFANLPVDRGADAFSVVIRCTSECDIDNKTISKYARALRYVARRKESDMPGLNRCAAGYARYYGRCVRQISQG